MKKSLVAGSTLAVLAIAGYSIYQLWKCENPLDAHCLEKSLKNMGRDLEKSMEDMM